MSSGISQDRVDLLMRNLAVLLPAAGISKEVAISALERAFEATTAEAQEPDGSIDALPREGRMFVSHLLAVWSNSGSYSDQMGRPLELFKLGPAPSIEALYEQATADMTDPASVPGLSTIDEMVSHLTLQDCIEETPDGQWRLLRDFYATSGSAVSPSSLLDYAIDFLSTSRENYGAPTLFQRVARTTRFSSTKLSKINQIVDEHGMEFLRIVDSHITDDLLSDDGTEEPLEMGVGVYLYRRPSG